MIRVDVLDSSPIFMLGLTQALFCNGFEVVGARTSVLDNAGQADVFLVDPAALSKNPVEHVAATAKIGATLIVFWTQPRRDLVDTFRFAGASGFFSKRDPVEKLTKLINTVAGGKAGKEPGHDGALPSAADPGSWRDSAENLLSMREEQVLQQIMHGLTHSQIARRLGISRNTVDTYVKRLRAKLGVGNKADLTRVAMLRKSAASSC